MRRFVEGVSRDQASFLPECLDDFVGEDNPVRVVDVFVDELDLRDLGFERVDPCSTGRPSYHPAVLLKLYIYGYLSRVQSSRRLEHETDRNVEVMWPTGRLVPDHKTIADFRKYHGKAIRKVGSRFVELCGHIGFLAEANVAIDGPKFKAVNNRDRNFTKAKMARRTKQIEESVEWYLHQLDSADRQEPTEAIRSRVARPHEKIDKLRSEMHRLKALEVESFNGMLRGECLNEHLFTTLRQARKLINGWRNDYNMHRPRTGLDGLTPYEFATRSKMDQNRNRANL